MRSSATLSQPAVGTVRDLVSFISYKRLLQEGGVASMQTEALLQTALLSFILLLEKLRIAFVMYIRFFTPECGIIRETEMKE